MLEDFTPSSTVPQFVKRKLSAKEAEIPATIYLVTWLCCHPAFLLGINPLTACIALGKSTKLFYQTQFMHG